MVNAASYLLKTNSAWSAFKNIQISKEIETTCSSLRTGKQMMCPRFLALKTLVNILQPFIDIRNTFVSVQRIMFWLQWWVMNSCSLLHRQNSVRGFQLRSLTFKLRHHDQYSLSHCETQACWVLWTHCYNIMSQRALREISEFQNSCQLWFIWASWEEHMYSQNLRGQEKSSNQHTQQRCRSDL